MRVVVFAAHPDDEVLGCGGTIARHSACGDDVFVVIAAEGMMARAKGNVGDHFEGQKRTLWESARRAATVLGVKEVVHFGFPDNRMDGVELLEIIRKVEESLAAYNPDIVYTHYHGDLNIDHSILSKAVVTATRPLPHKLITEIYAFEVPSSTEWAFGLDHAGFRPNHFVGIESSLQRKIDAMAFYSTEIRPFPHPRSPEAIRALAMRRGGQAGLKAAEAFMLLRRVLPEKEERISSDEVDNDYSQKSGTP